MIHQDQASVKPEKCSTRSECFSRAGAMVARMVRAGKPFPCGFEEIAAHDIEDPSLSTACVEPEAPCNLGPGDVRCARVRQGRTMTSATTKQMNGHNWLELANSQEENGDLDAAYESFCAA